MVELVKKTLEWEEPIPPTGHENQVGATFLCPSLAGSDQKGPGDRESFQRRKLSLAKRRGLFPEARYAWAGGYLEARHPFHNRREERRMLGCEERQAP